MIKFLLFSALFLTVVGEKGVKWVADIFTSAERNFVMIPETGPSCQRDWNSYKLHLNNQTLWAVQMLESSEWPSIGIFNGRNYHFGNIDECLAISTTNMKGKYCLADARFRIKFNVQPSLQDDRQQQSLPVWQWIQTRDATSGKSGWSQRWAMCVPSSCTTRDLQISLNATLTPEFASNNMTVNASVDPIFCQTQDDLNVALYPISFFVATSIACLVFAMVFICTITEGILYATKNEEENLKKSSFEIFISIFSAIFNTRKLFKRTSKDVDAVNLINVFALITIICTYRFVDYITTPMTDDQIEQLWTDEQDKIHFEKILTLGIDLLFMAAGFLTFYHSSAMTQKPALYFPLSVLNQWIKMVPVFTLLALYAMYIFPYTSYGPLWNFKVKRQVDICTETWWSNLFLVSNFFDIEKQCMMQSWFVSTSVQLSILGAILSYFSARNVKCGMFMVSLVAFTSATVTFTRAYAHPGQMALHITTMSRILPYLVGFAAAAFAKISEDAEYKITAVLKFITGVFFSMIAVVIVIRSHKPYTKLENALYMATARGLFVLPFALFANLSLNSGLGFLDIIAKNKIILWGGRLTYPAFIVSFLLETYFTGTIQFLLGAPHILNIFWLAVSDVLWFYICGYLVHLCVCAPTEEIWKIIRHRVIYSTGVYEPRQNTTNSKA